MKVIEKFVIKVFFISYTPVFIIGFLLLGLIGGLCNNSARFYVNTVSNFIKSIIVRVPS
jgi:hypothetical protein